MNRVAPEVAQEIGMLFENDNIDSGSCEQESQHHTGRSAADDTAARRDRLHDYSNISFLFYLREILQRALSHVCAASATFSGTSGRFVLSTN